MKKLILLHTDKLIDSLFSDTFFLPVLILLALSLLYLIYKYSKNK